MASAYLIVGLARWLNFFLDGGRWRLLLAALWTVLGGGMAYLTATSKRRQHKKSQP